MILLVFFEKPGEAIPIHLSSFHACRYPAFPKDTAHKFDPAIYNHVVFILNNRYFDVELAYPKALKLTESSVADLEAYVLFFDLFLDRTDDN